MNDGDMLAGCRVLVVEDEALVSMLLQDMLNDMGCHVAGTASRFDEALQKCQTVPFDVALLDINLRGRPIFPLAEALRDRGQCFVLTTGYGESVVPESLRDAIVLQKPYQRVDLERSLRRALSREAS